MTNAAIRENAGLLLAWSVFALVEGTIRMVLNSKPSEDVDYFTDNDNTTIPVVALLAGGVGEVLFGISGVYLALFSLLLNRNNPFATLGFMVMQGVLGWFVFLTFVIAAPIIDAKNATGTDLLSQSEQRSLILLGNMVGSICFCWALQGGQFIMALRLWQSQKGVVESKSKNALRGKIWSGNMVAAAVSTLYVGSLLQSKGFTSTTAPIGAPPHVVWFPVISLLTGIVMLGYGILGFLAPGNLAAAKHMPIAFVVTTTAMMINFSWTFGIVPGLAPPIPGAAQHIGLILAVTILPLFHAHRSHVLASEEDDDDNKGAKAASHLDLEDPHSVRA